MNMLAQVKPIETDETELVLAHQYLDRMYIPREYEGVQLSLMGRLGLLRKKLAQRVRYYHHHALWLDIFGYSVASMEENTDRVTTLVERIARSLEEELIYKVGEYVVDYSEPDLKAWKTPDPNLEALLANSRVVSKKQ